MDETRISIGQVKRDISELVNRVTYGGERVVLTSRGRPKAALVSMADYERMTQRETAEARTSRRQAWQRWQAQSAALNTAILEDRGGKPLDVDALWRAAREELEARDDRSVA